MTDKIDPMLRYQLGLAKPDQVLEVLVQFGAPPSADDLAALGLAALGPDMGTGGLDRAAIERLAQRPDVVRVSAPKKMYPA